MTTRKYLIADLFCGAGGSSTGAAKAIETIGGRMELVAVNHWQTAIETHSANHPEARHIVEDVNLVDPEAVVEEGRLDLLMASPECKFYSRARGGKPIHDQGRMHPWAVMNWLTKLDIRCALIENVPEFVDWGPVDTATGKPIKQLKGQAFQAWFLTFGALGYRAEWRMLNAADYGDATTRTRFFLIARKDGRPIEWPEPTHAKADYPMFPGRLPWRGAKEIIDWSNPGRSLLDDQKYLKKPLSKNTRRRIARGLERFGGILAPLYIRLLDLPPDDGGEPFILNRHSENGSDRTHSAEDSPPTVTTKGAGYLMEPEAQPFHGSDRQHTAPRSMEQPVPTITTLTRGGLYTVRPEAKPFVTANRNENAPKRMEEPVPPATTAYGGGIFLTRPEMKPFMPEQQSGSAPRSTDDPAPTITADGAISLLRRVIIQCYGNSCAQDVESPLSAITSMNKHGLAQSVLIEYYGNSDAASVDRPLPTVTAKARHGLAEPTLVDLNHGNGTLGDRGNNCRVHSVEDPLPTVTGSRGIALAHPVMVQTGQTGGNGIYARDTDSPIPTLTTKNDIGIATPAAKPFVVPNFGEWDGHAPRAHDIDRPAPAVTGKGTGNLATPTLDESFLEDLTEAGIDPRRLVLVDGQPFLLDIRFRMLQNAELARAMGFDDHETSYEFVGNVSEITKQIGNAVPVHLAAALVRAVLDPDAEGAKPGDSLPEHDPTGVETNDSQ